MHPLYLPRERQPQLVLAMGAVEAEPVQQQRQQLVEVARQMNACGVNQGTSGNLSLRIEGGLLITPSSLPYEQMEAPDLVAISFEGEPLVAGQRRPSSEWRLHADLLRHRPDAAAVVHAIRSTPRPWPATGWGFPAFTTWLWRRVELISAARLRHFWHPAALGCGVGCVARSLRLPDGPSRPGELGGLAARCARLGD